MSDLIYRSAVLNILNEGAELLRHALENVDITGVVRVKYEWGLGLIESCIADVKELQPERMEGEWIPVQRCEGDTQPDLECPFCKHRIGWFDMRRYCAGCGAKLNDFS